MIWQLQIASMTLILIALVIISGLEASNCGPTIWAKFLAHLLSDGWLD